jgi:hypothetical protein
MVRSLWEVFLALVGSTEAEAEDDESRFVPSPLDVSVRVGHGGRDDEVVRELSNVSERAQQLDGRRDDR